MEGKRCGRVHPVLRAHCHESQCWLKAWQLLLRASKNKIHIHDMYTEKNIETNKLPARLLLVGPRHEIHRISIRVQSLSKNATGLGRWL